MDSYEEPFFTILSLVKGPIIKKFAIDLSLTGKAIKFKDLYLFQSNEMS